MSGFNKFSSDIFKEPTHNVKRLWTDKDSPELTLEQYRAAKTTFNSAINAIAKYLEPFVDAGALYAGEPAQIAVYVVDSMALSALDDQTKELNMRSTLKLLHNNPKRMKVAIQARREQIEREILRSGRKLPDNMDRLWDNISGDRVLTHGEVLTKQAVSENFVPYFVAKLSSAMVDDFKSTSIGLDVALRYMQLFRGILPRLMRDEIEQMSGDMLFKTDVSSKCEDWVKRAVSFVSDKAREQLSKDNANEFIQKLNSSTQALSSAFNTAWDLVSGGKTAEMFIDMLIILANDLDDRGFEKEASVIDNILKGMINE